MEDDSARAGFPDPRVRRSVTGAASDPDAVLRWLPIDVRREVSVAAQSTLPVVLEGETGTGKTFLARTIHRLGPRAACPFVPVTCTNLAGSMPEAELFGHERGAYTDAREKRAGLVESADRGTLFLDEIAEVSLSDQARLLAVVEEGAFRRIGGNHPIPVDVRVISATNRDLDSLLESGGIRPDLFYRIAALRIRLHPLRERPERIPGLIDLLFATITSRAIGLTGNGEWCIEPAAVEALQSRPWPGNIRQLRHVLERALIESAGSCIRVEHVTASIGLEKPVAWLGREGAHTASSGLHRRYRASESPDEERRRIVGALHAQEGNKRRAAYELGMSRSTLSTSIKCYRIEEDEWKP